MLRGIRLATWIVAFGGTMVLTGCADSVYPRLPGLGSSTNSNSSLLSPTEQQKAIDDLAAEQKSHGTAAAKEIERRE
jgi:hypothetical protein